MICSIVGNTIKAQESPKIEDIQPYIKNDSLMCSFASPELFNGTIKQTLLSGLPILIEITPKFSGNGIRHAIPMLFKYRLTYDIWEDRYAVESKGKKRFFSSLTALGKWWNPKERIPLIPLKRIDKTKPLKIDIYLKIVLLSRSQGQKLKDWILNAYETEEKSPSLDRNTGFKLNLNKVVSLFFSRSEVIESFEARNTSGSFEIGNLPGSK